VTPLAWAKLAAIAALIAGTWWHGRSTGADTVQARWDADTVARERAQQAQEAAQRRRAHDASAQYQAGAAKRAQAQQSLRADLEAALSTPACPKEATDVSLADLVVPAASLARLRVAGADPAD
jgi:hypothetical protein